MTLKKYGNLVIHTTKLTAKTKTGRAKQWKKIMAESNRICAQMEAEEKALARARG